MLKTLPLLILSTVFITACQSEAIKPASNATLAANEPVIGMTIAEMSFLCGAAHPAETETLTNAERTTVIETRFASNEDLAKKKCGGKYAYKNGVLSSIQR